MRAILTTNDPLRHPSFNMPSHSHSPSLSLFNPYLLLSSSPALTLCTCFLCMNDDITQQRIRFLLRLPRVVSGRK